LDKNDNVPPKYPGTESARRLDWIGSGTVMVGAAAAGAAFIFIHQMWLWILAGVLIVAGVIVWLVGGLGSSSGRGRIRQSGIR
jgi:membrane protein YdbS with pleckstrin-like domain